MDTWMGNNHDPITLHKYLYGYSDPANFTDPSGNIGLASFGTASNIRATLATTSVPQFSSAISSAIGATLQVSGRAMTKLALRNLRKCIRQKNKCGLRVNLLIVGYDNPAILDHIRDAQTQTPRTIVLNYQANKPGNRRWYAAGGGKGGCGKQRPSGYQCDEYPFFKTREGGPGKAWVSLRWVPPDENSSVGGHFGFLAKSLNKSKDKRFVVITSDSLPTVALPIAASKK